MLIATTSFLLVHHSCSSSLLFGAPNFCRPVSDAALGTRTNPVKAAIITVGFAFIDVLNSVMKLCSEDLEPFRTWTQSRQFKIFTIKNSIQDQKICCNPYTHIFFKKLFQKLGSCCSQNICKILLIYR